LDLQRKQLDCDGESINMPSTYLGKHNTWQTQCNEGQANANRMLRESMFADAELLIWEPEYRIVLAASQTDEPRMRYLHRRGVKDARMKASPTTDLTADVTMSHRDNDLDHDLNGAPTDAAPELTLLERVRDLQQRTEQLEQTAATMRQVLEQMAERVANAPIVIYYIEGETYEIKRADIEDIRRKMVKPRAERTLIALALAHQMAERQAHLPREEKAKRFMQTVEAIRAQSLADGTAIEHEYEAAFDD
jgi:hypothetical protein